MEWGSKMPYWDIAELEPGIGSVMGLSSGGWTCQGRGLDCSVDLRLGGSAVAIVPPSSGGPSKRLRPASGGGSQAVSCLVDGCLADLSKCREYHRRHKVCEAHSKTPVVSVAGKEQRFCQQCSRFHLLVEFDEVKRSCRKRLEGHNRRRRKPPSGPINSGSIFMTFQGAKFSSYSQLFPSSMADPKWANGALHTHCSPVHLTDRRQSPLSFQQEDCALFSGRQVPEAPPSESNCSKMFVTAGLNRILSTECALSLLSPPKTSNINFGQMMPPADRVPAGQPLFSDLQHRSFLRSSGPPCSDMMPTNENLCCFLAADNGDVDAQFQGFYQIAGEGSSNGACPNSTFSMATTDLL